MKQRQLSLLLSTAFIISACVTTTPTATDSGESPQFDHNWSETIPAINSEIRACIITNKATENIRYATVDSAAHQAQLFIEKNGVLYSCRVDQSSYKVLATEPSTLSIPETLPRFYPYGRTPKECHNSRKINDERGRLMGHLCS